jgi:hypothetical protein
MGSLERHRARERGARWRGCAKNHKCKKEGMGNCYKEEFIDKKLSK